MYRDLKFALIAPCYNERSKIEQVVQRAPDWVDHMVVVDDGSTDGSAERCEELGATVLRMGACIGVGAALRLGYEYALDQGVDVAVVIAGNNKDSPEELPVLLDPIVNGSADFVQGSRYLKRNAHFGDMPAYRKVATRLHPLMVSALGGQRMTDSTNGYRAVHRRILEDDRIDLSQGWLDEYELEPYLLLQALRLGYRVVEVPVSKVYPPRHMGNTKMKPITGWWSMLRPLVRVALERRRS